MTSSASFEEWDDSEAWSEAADLEAGLGEVLGHDPGEITPENVDGWLDAALTRLTPIESESFGKALGQLGAFARSPAVRQFAGTALPIAGTAIGTLYGGSVGGALGSQLGTAASSAIVGRGAGAPRKPVRATVRAAPAAEPAVAEPASGGELGATAPVVDDGGAEPAAPGTTTAANGHDGSQAAAQLLYLIQNPTVLAGLLSLALGTHGRDTVPGPDGKPIKRGALVAMLKHVAERAAEEADAFTGDAAAESTPSYLLDASGRYLCDPANPEERADVLLGMLERQDEALWQEEWEEEEE